MNSPTGSIRQHRRRQRIACDSCRERKRKCDGKKPCNQCERFEYDCFYRTTPRSRRARTTAAESLVESTGSPSAAFLSTSQSKQSVPSPARGPDGRTPHDGHFGDDGILQAIEGNSGAAFARSLIRTLDPHDVPTMRMLAWNIFLGSRQVNTAQAETLQEIVSEEAMRQLAQVYLSKIQPCYGFTDSLALHAMIDSVWNASDTTNAQIAVLCGIAALACLFAGDQDLEVEVKLVSLAKRLLDPALAEPPSSQSATAWLLRAVYLRLTARPEEAWLASCTTMHVIDAAGLANPARKNVNGPAQDAHWQRRVLDVAQHLNIWMSYDLGRCRVVLRDIDTTPTASRPGEYTAELLELLPYSQDLDPANDMNGRKLTAALEAVLNRVHTEPPSVMAQCNLMLCIYRRLHAARTEIAGVILAPVIDLLRRGITAVHSAITIGMPWHHVANIPFQTVCTLLAIDTPESLLLLGDALACVRRVNDVYCTAATQEAATTATSLLQLHRLRREAEIRKHSSMLDYYPLVPQASSDDAGVDMLDDLDILDSWWHHEFGPISLDDPALA
ncbi:hypothetical protein AMS68_004368 [Peltaster fructicola]|uniref:Zn(2)-C6 fungal-type domain-containing protein n=1 Tax=Peltaster fructicola TaxID=286661 RepID=A0A6H0XW12_9PEZI|nr:hypothetical protein AMS68_004368 [Peltaster fructicola]